MGNMLVNLFIDDTRTFSATLAAKIGLDEAIFIQQVHYWLQRSENIQDGYKWVYNSVAEWKKQLKYPSESTIKRTIKHLRDMGLLIVSSYNRKNFDRTNWYRIDYDKFNEILEEIMSEGEENEDEELDDIKIEECHYDRVKMTQSDKVKMTQSERVNLTRPIPKNTTKNTTKNSSIVATSSPESSEPPADVAAIPLNDGSEWRPAESLAEEYVRLYPNVDVRQAFNAMRAWCMSNPSKRKTKSGVTRFVNRWLSKEQDSGRKAKSEPKYKEDQFDYLYS